MAMKKQPEGIRRVPRGERKVNPDTGKKLPADQYDIFQGELYLGWTERGAGGRGWYAHTPPFSGPGEFGHDSDKFADHTAAVEWLVEQARNGGAPTSQGEPEPQAAPASEGGPGSPAAPKIEGGPTEAGAPDHPGEPETQAAPGPLGEQDSDTQPDPYVDALAAEHEQEFEPSEPGAPEDAVLDGPPVGGAPEPEGDATAPPPPASDPFAQDPFGKDPFVDPFA